MIREHDVEARVQSPVDESAPSLDSIGPKPKRIDSSSSIVGMGCRMRLALVRLIAFVPLAHRIAVARRFRRRIRRSSLGHIRRRACSSWKRVPFCVAAGMWGRRSGSLARRSTRFAKHETQPRPERRANSSWCPCRPRRNKRSASSTIRNRIQIELRLHFTLGARRGACGQGKGPVGGVGRADVAGGSTRAGRLRGVRP